MRSINQRLKDDSIMKRSFIAILFLLSACGMAFSQVPDIALFARVNTIWSIGKTNMNPMYPPQITYYKLCEGEIVDNAIVCPMKSGESLDNIAEWDVAFKVRLTSDSLLYYEFADMDPMLVFDFKMKVGDEAVLTYSTAMPEMQFLTKVCNIDMMENSGHQFKQWEIANIDTDFDLFDVADCSTTNKDYWISGIGGICGFEFIYHRYLVGLMGMTDIIFCVWNGNELIYKDEDYDYCTMTEVQEPVAENIEVFPNPSNGKFSISLPESAEKCELRIINVLGQVVRNLAVDGKTIEIDGLTKGLYKVIVAGDDVIFEKSVVVE